MNEAKPFVIDKRLVWEAYHKVKENKGSAGIDKVDQKTFDKEMSKNLYKIWNRMSWLLLSQSGEAGRNTKIQWRYSPFGHTND